MSTLDGPQPDEPRPEPAQAATGPTVSTAPPPRAPRRWSKLPTHVGPARTSTIVLAILFVGIFALYLGVRPEPPVTAGSTSTPTDQPANRAPAGRTTPPPTRTTTTTPHTPSPSPTETTTGTPTTTGPAPGTVRAPGQTSGSSSPLPTLPTSGSAPTS